MDYVTAWNNPKLDNPITDIYFVRIPIQLEPCNNSIQHFYLDVKTAKNSTGNDCEHGHKENTIPTRIIA